MWIKSIKINGCPSYVGHNSLSDLSSGLNVIVGRTGSGKTNFLNAIQFVLSDECMCLDTNQRQQPIDQKNIRQNVESSVEVMFDNTDRRIPIDLNEIVFRRQICGQKDEYSLNDQTIEWSEMADLLMVSGLCKPFNVVKQGIVKELATASDAHRLQVIRQIANSIYSQRVKHSSKLLAETVFKLEQISNCLDSLNKTLESHISEVERQRLDAILEEIENNPQNYSKRLNRTDLSDLLNRILVIKQSFDCYSIDNKIKFFRKQLTQKSQIIDPIIEELNRQKEILDNLNSDDVKDRDSLNSGSKKSRRIAFRRASVHLGDIKDRLNSLSFEKKQIESIENNVRKLNKILEQQRYEAIKNISDEIREHFIKLFEEFIPEGKVCFDYISSHSNRSDSSPQSTEGTQESQSTVVVSGQTLPILTVNNVLGANIRVAFNQTELIKDINELSNSHKTIVSLVLVVALLCCDPSPIYIIDQLDESLEPCYRKALAEMISELSDSTQVITTVSKTELIQFGHKFFGIDFKNGMSQIEEINKEKAKQLIESDSGTVYRTRRRTQSIGSGKWINTRFNDYFTEF